jgi:hypothetical protein
MVRPWLHTCSCCRQAQLPFDDPGLLGGSILAPPVALAERSLLGGGMALSSIQVRHVCPAVAVRHGRWFSR